MDNSLLNMAREKLASMEKDAAKWERQMIDRAKKGLMSMLDAKEYRDMFTKAYGKVRDFTRSGNKRLDILRAKAKSGDPTAQKLYNNMRQMHTWDMNRVSASPKFKNFKPENTRFAKEFDYGPLRIGPSQAEIPSMENIVNSRGDIIRFLNENGDRLKELSKNTTTAHKALSETGGKEPFIRGLSQMISLSPEYTRQLERSISYDKGRNPFLDILGGRSSILSQQTIDSLSRGVETVPRTGMITPTFVTKYAPVAKSFTNHDNFRNNNYMIGDISSIDKKLLELNPGAKFLPGLNFANMEGRNTFANNVMKELGVDLSKFDNSPVAKDLRVWGKKSGMSPERLAKINALGSSNFEAALLPDMLAQTNPKEFHLFNNRRHGFKSYSGADSVFPDTGILPFRVDVEDSLTTASNLDNTLITKVIKELKNREDIKAIPLDDYIEGASTIQHFLKNMRDKGALTSETLMDMYQNDAIGRNIIDLYGFRKNRIRGNEFYQGKALENLLNETNIGLVKYLQPFIR